jgi:hypothetical protein
MALTQLGCSSCMASADALDERIGVRAGCSRLRLIGSV